MVFRSILKKNMNFLKNSLVLYVFHYNEMQKTTIISYP